MPPIYRSRPQGASGLAALVGGFLSGREEEQERRRQERADEEERTRRTATEGRLADENRRAEARFEKEMDEDGYEKRGMATTRAKAWESTGGMGTVVGAMLRGADHKAEKEGRNYIKTKDSRSEREAKDRREREVEIAGIRAEFARQKQEDAQRHAKEIEDIKDKNRDEAQMRRILLGGGAGSTSAEKQRAALLNRQISDTDRQIKDREGKLPKREQNFAAQQAADNPKLAAANPKLKEADARFRADSTAADAALDLPRLRGRREALEDARGDTAYDGEEAPVPAATQGPSRSPNRQRGIQQQYDQAATAYQSALARITDPKKRELARQRYEQQVKQIAAAVGDIE